MQFLQACVEREVLVWQRRRQNFEVQGLHRSHVAQSGSLWRGGVRFEQSLEPCHSRLAARHGALVQERRPDGGLAYQFGSAGQHFAVDPLCSRSPSTDSSTLPRRDSVIQGRLSGVGGLPWTLGARLQRRAFLAGGAWRVRCNNAHGSKTRGCPPRLWHGPRRKVW